jgi:uncharacterized protein DUF4911
VLRSDAVPDVVPIFLAVPRREIAYVKFVVESYDGVAVTRTIDRHAAVLVLLVAPDFLPTARAIVAALERDAGVRVVDPPPGPFDPLGEEPLP